MKKEFVTYTDFGAAGDGVTDDFRAILSAHEYANLHSVPVILKDEKTYLIRDTVIDGVPKCIKIMTDVDWGSSKIIIDDTDVDFFDGTGVSATPIFKVVSEYEPFDITSPDMLSRFSCIGEGTKKLDLGLGYPALAVIHNEDHRVYHRYGSFYTSRGGQSSPMHEILLLDDKGNIDTSTPFMFDYDHLTKITVVRCDINPITLAGGIFITRASRKKAYYSESKKIAKYFMRNLVVNRSYTTLNGIAHYVENEIALDYFMENDHPGAHYMGFYYIELANEVTLKNCVLTGRTSYRFSTYEFYANRVNKIRLDGCTQSNFTLRDENGNEAFSMSPSALTNWPRCWGIGGTNFCKNMEYDRCTLSRFDAHQGLYNGKVSNSKINFMEVIGKGELIIENVEWFSPAPGIYNSFVYLREDYGCTWDGTITFKNCTMHPSTGSPRVFYYLYTNWDYGYKCYFPDLIIDNMKIEGLDKDESIHIVSEKSSILREPDMHLAKTRYVPIKDHSGKDDENNMTNLNPVVPPKFIRIQGNAPNHKFILPKCDFFSKTEKLGVTEEEF